MDFLVIGVIFKLNMLPLNKTIFSVSFHLYLGETLSSLKAVLPKNAEKIADW